MNRPNIMLNSNNLREEETLITEENEPEGYSVTCYCVGIERVLRPRKYKAILVIVRQSM